MNASLRISKWIFDFQAVQAAAMRPQDIFEKLAEVIVGEPRGKFFLRGVQKFLDDLKTDDAIPGDGKFVKFQATDFLLRVLIRKCVNQDVCVEEKFSAHSFRRAS